MKKVGWVELSEQAEMSEWRADENVDTQARTPDAKGTKHVRTTARFLELTADAGPTTTLSVA